MIRSYRLASPPSSQSISSRFARSALLLALVGALGLTAFPRPAAACRFLISFVEGNQIVGARAERYPPVPRNAAFLWSSVSGGAPPSDAFAVATDATSNALIMGHVVRPIYNASEPSVGLLLPTFIVKTGELLPPGRPVSPVDKVLPVYTTGDYVDETSPTAPEIVDGLIQHQAGEAAGGPCPATTGLAVTLAGPVTDDHTPSGLLAYAVYLEKTAIEAASAKTAFALIQMSSATNPEQLHAFVAHAWKDAPAYLAVSAIDFAGNESQRSNVFEISRGGATNGCACQMQQRRASTIAVVLPLLMMVAWARRWTRQSS